MSQWKVGDTASSLWVFSQDDVAAFALISGDDNDLHLNEAEAAKSIFKRPVVHGILTTGRISALLGTQLPGKGTAFLGADFKFKAPLYPGEEIEARVTVTAIDDVKKKMKLDAVVSKTADGTIVVTATVEVLLRDRVMLAA